VEKHEKRSGEGIMRLLRALIVAGLLAPAPVSSVLAQTVIDKPVTIYVAGTAGGGIDIFARVVGRHLGSHIPGNPAVNVQVMPGAGGIRAANFMAQQAPKDGTAIAAFAGGPILQPLIGARDPGYDMSQFTWIGAVTKDVSVCMAWGNSPFKTIDDVKKQQMSVAGTGAGSDTDLWPLVLNDVMGTKFRVITGYLGSQETILAIERGEVHGRCGWSLSSLKSTKPNWLSEKKINILLQIAAEKSPELPDVPLVFDLVSRLEDRQMLELLSGPMGMARPLVGPPGLDPEKATVLRRAFDATMKDPAFLADAAKIQAEVAPTSGEKVQALVRRSYQTPRAVIVRAKKFLSTER
jgi:tripartite-type tricarboxylate transporter receptor subunit TctC